MSWNAYTVDDYAWRAAPAAAGAIAEDRWVVLVDGRPAGAGALGVNSLERLPLDIAAIDSVVFVSSPELAAGRIVGDGIVHIYTRSPRDGVSARGRLAIGSETGDPGPFVFLPDGGRNRDRYGQDLAAGAGFSRGGWYVDGGVASAVHLPTDPRIFRRLAASAFLPPRIERTAGNIRMGRAGPAGGHHILAGASRLDDRLRLELAGSELPARATLTHLSGHGASALDRFDFRYHAGFEDARAATRPDATLPPFDYQWRTLRAGAEVADRSVGSRRVGVALLHRRGMRDDSVSLGRELDLRAYAEFGWQPVNRVRQSASVSLGGQGDGLAGGAILSQSVELSNAGTLALQLFVSRDHAITDLGLLDLAARGDEWLASAGVPPNLQDFEGMSTEAGAALGWERRTERATISATAYMRARGDVVAVDRSLQWDEGLHAWRGPVLAEPTSGRVSGLEVAAHLRPFSDLRFHGRYRLAAASGDPLFRRLSERSPRHRGIVSTGWQPVPGFGIEGAAEFRSRGVWAEYQDTGPAPGKARPVVPGNISLSATVWKTLMGGRLRGQLTGRNLAGGRVIHHPEGSAGGLAFIFLLGADL